MRLSDSESGVPAAIEAALEDVTADILMLSEIVAALAVVGSDRPFAEVPALNETEH